MIRVSAEVYKQMLDYAFHLQPNEACGALIGTVIQDKITVNQIYPIRNVSLFPDQQFKLNPEQWIECLYTFKESPIQIVGIFHSHPNHVPVPSFEDLQLPWDFPTYWILSFAQPISIVKAYKLMPHIQFNEQQIIITSSSNNKKSSAPLSG